MFVPGNFASLETFNDYILDVCDNMQKYGGSWVKTLAQLLILSDPENRYKLYNTFKDIIDSYYAVSSMYVYLPATKIGSYLEIKDGDKFKLIDENIQFNIRDENIVNSSKIINLGKSTFLTNNNYSVVVEAYLLVNEFNKTYKILFGGTSDAHSTGLLNFTSVDFCYVTVFSNNNEVIKDELIRCVSTLTTMSDKEIKEIYFRIGLPLLNPINIDELSVKF